MNLEILVEKGELSNVVAEVTQSAGTATGDGPVEMAEPESKMYTTGTITHTH